MSEEAQKRIFTKRLNSYVNASGKTQLEIAKSIGVSPQTFNTWCKGVAIPRMSKLQALADYFSINKSDLIENIPENEHKKIFSKNLRYYMNKYNKKQSDLINDLGFSSSTISNWCTGEKLPRMDKVQMLADYFHINKSDLLEDKTNSKDDEPYYFNEEAREIAQFMYENPEYKVLFDASRKVKKEDIDFVKQMIDRMSNTEE